MKRQDVVRSIARETDELLERAQELVAGNEELDEAALREVEHLVQTARMRSRRLADTDIEDRFAACNALIFDAIRGFKSE